jgi:hypothetical protein
MTQLINTIYETGECPKDFMKLQRLPYWRRQTLQNIYSIAQSASSHI